MVRLDGPRRDPASGGPARQLIVLCHGLAADGADLIEFAAPLAKILPDAAFAAPDAPDVFDQEPDGRGRQWFGIVNRDEAALVAGIRAVAPVLSAFVTQEQARTGVAPAATILAGFSQGAMTVLFTGLRLAPPVAGIIAFSGGLIDPASLAADLTARPPVLLVHGEADQVVPVVASRRAEARLRAAGVPVFALYRPGLGHSIDSEGLGAAAAFMLDRFAGVVTTGPAV